MKCIRQNDIDLLSVRIDVNDEFEWILNTQLFKLILKRHVSLCSITTITTPAVVVVRAYMLFGDLRVVGFGSGWLGVSWDRLTIGEIHFVIGSANVLE